MHFFYFACCISTQFFGLRRKEFSPTHSFMDAVTCRHPKAWFTRKQKEATVASVQTSSLATLHGKQPNSLSFTSFFCVFSCIFDRAAHVGTKDFKIKIIRNHQFLLSLTILSLILSSSQTVCKIVCHIFHFNLILLFTSMLTLKHLFPFSFISSFWLMLLFGRRITFPFHLLF